MDDEDRSTNPEQSMNAGYSINPRSFGNTNISKKIEEEDAVVDEAESSKEGDVLQELTRFQLFKKHILDDFKRWLDELEEPDFCQLRELRNSSNEDPDLQTFFRELVALRQDVRLQSKANKSIGQNISQLSSSLEDKINTGTKSLANAVIDIKSQIPEARRDAQRGIALEFLSVVEGLERCANSLSSKRISSLKIGLKKKKKKKAIESLRKPHRLLYSKALDSLRRLKIEPVAAIGDEFDPKSMRVVGTTKNSGAKAGVVTEICLQGYKIENSLIRTAEVKVEK